MSPCSNLVRSGRCQSCPHSSECGSHTAGPRVWVIGSVRRSLIPTTLDFLHPVSSHPIPPHPVSYHLISFQLISSHLILSPLLPSHLLYSPPFSSPPFSSSPFSSPPSHLLPGGERSFSTLCFALALHHLTEAPFRAVDEFDIFMVGGWEGDVTTGACEDAKGNQEVMIAGSLNGVFKSKSASPLYCVVSHLS